MPLADNMEPKTPSESQSLLTHVVRQEDLNMHGSFFGGAMLALMDTAAAVAAMRHTHRNCVTARMSDVSFFAPVHLGHILTLEGRVHFTARTSIDVGVRAMREDHITGEKVEVCRANVTFVAIDGDGNPMPVPPVELETDEDREMNAYSQKRYDERKMRKSQLKNTMGIPAKEDRSP